MSEAKPEPSVGQLAAQIVELKAGLKALMGIFLVVLSLPNILAALAIHRFEEIYQDTLAGQALPSITMAFVGHPQFVQFLAFAWPVGGLIFLALLRRVLFWSVGGVLLIFAVGLQFALTEYAMIMPLFAIDPGMSR